jgi:SAM-dependent methyltransferase
VPESDLRAESAIGSFDAIVLTDVFEHLIDPMAVMKLLANRLRPGGNLAIVTGLTDAVRPRTLIAEHWYFRLPGHLQMLSLRHLEWLGQSLRLEVASIATMSHYKRSALPLVRQAVQRALYSVQRLEPQSRKAALLRLVPYLRRAARWTNLPSTNLFSDHVLAVLCAPR